MSIDEDERARRRRLLKIHIDAEQARDLDAVMATFAPHAVNSLNEITATDSETTRLFHVLLGFSRDPGLLSDLQVLPTSEHFTDEEIVHEGELRGFHSGYFPGFPLPSFRDVVMPYVAIYRFDEHDMLVSERIKLDLSPLFAPSPSTPEGP